jgi:hypothetical protein
MEKGKNITITPTTKESYDGKKFYFHYDDEAGMLDRPDIENRWLENKEIIKNGK